MQLTKNLKLQTNSNILYVFINDKTVQFGSTNNLSKIPERYNLSEVSCQLKRGAVFPTILNGNLQINK